MTASKGLLQHAEFAMKNQVIAVGGTTVIPTFDRIKYYENMQMLQEVEVKSSPDAGEAHSSAADDRHQAPSSSTFLESTDDPLPGAHILKDLPSSTKKPKKSGSNGTAAGATSADQSSEELTLEERARSRRPSADQSIAEDGEGLVSLSSGSMRLALEQAIQLGSYTQINKVLCRTTYLDATTSTLNCEYVQPLLKILLQKMQKHPNRTAAIMWLRSLLSCQASYLLSVPGLVHSLTGVYALIDTRLKSYETMVKLSGRLDLLLSQSSANRKTTSEEAAFQNVYTEPTNEEMEDDEEEDEEEEDDDLDDSDLDEEDEGELEEVRDLIDRDDDDDDGEEKDDDLEDE